MKEIALNTHVGNDKQMMTSLEITQVTGKQHKDVLKAIRNMEPAWTQVAGRKFALSEYQDSTGRSLPCYQLTKTECLYIATKFNDELWLYAPRNKKNEIFLCIFLGFHYLCLENTTC